MHDHKKALERYEEYAREGRAQWQEPGPWDNEPNREEFEHAGFPCIVQRGPAGGWCGYVGIPPEHPLHGVGYSNRRVERLIVHGGVTYAAECSASICHAPKPGEPERQWWLGFDCNHFGDIAPLVAHFFKFDKSSTYRTIDYVKRQTMALAEQLSAKAKGEE